MPTIGSKVNDKEHQAIIEFVNQCGETVSNLIRKVMIGYATLLDSGWPNEHPEYEFSIQIPKNTLSDKEEKMMEEKINTVRKINNQKRRISSLYSKRCFWSKERQAN